MTEDNNNNEVSDEFLKQSTKLLFSARDEAVRSAASRLRGDPMEQAAELERILNSVEDEECSDEDDSKKNVRQAIKDFREGASEGKLELNLAQIVNQMFRLDVDEQFGDGEQSVVKGKEEHKLRTQWASGMDYNVRTNETLSGWCKICYYGQHAKVKECIDSADDVKKLIEKRESMLRFPAILHAICGARQGEKKVGTDHIKTVQYLIDAGCRVNCKDVAGYTPIHHCLTAYGNATTLKIAKILVQNGGDVNAQNRFGCVPLQECVMSMNVEFVKFLLDSGADPSIKEGSGIAPQQLMSQIPCFQALLSKSLLRRAKNDKAKRLEGGQQGKCANCLSAIGSRCSGCLVLSYCGKKCQRGHWSTHKSDCKAWGKSKMKVKISRFPDKKMGKGAVLTSINHQNGDATVTRGSVQTTEARPKKQHFSVKIQLPYEMKFGCTKPIPTGAICVYNKERTVNGFILPTEECHKKLFDVVCDKGEVGGIKGYFFAEFDEADGFSIQVANILPPEGW